MAILRAKVDGGIIEGTYSGIPEYSVFKGVPYAAPPIGKNRWRAPQPVQPWEGVYEAKLFKDIPVQVEERHPFYSVEFYRCRKPMSEDCLYLNIWTPAESIDEKLPVMFWIHGGGYKSGFSHEITMDGDAMARQGVILVTIEYRLGSLGYLAHEEIRDENGACGNYGLLDQIAALKWVKRNIAAFGGNPENITIFGQSAGAMSVENLMTSPLSKKDIAKAIMQSAGGYTGQSKSGLDMRSQLDAESYGRKFQEYLGCSGIDEMRGIPGEELVEKERIFIEQVCPEFSFCPIVDGYSQVKTCGQVVHDYEYADIPYIIGTTAYENGAFTYLPVPDHDKFVEGIHNRFGDEAEEFLDLIGYDQDPDKAIMQGGWDDMLKVWVYAWADHVARKPEMKPTYLYYFDRQMPGDQAGAYHSSELWYIFNTVHRCRRELTGVDYDLAIAMVKYWTNFAKNGDPNGEGLPEWTPYTKANRQSMELGEKIGMIPFVGTQRARFIVDRILKDD